MRRTTAVAACVVVVAIGAILCAGCGASETTTVDTESAPVPAPAESVPAEPEPIVPDEPPRAGAWEATATGSEVFTSFEFKVNTERAGITEFAYGYSNFKCGRMTESIGRSTSRFSSALPITAEGFTTGDPSSDPMMGIGIAVTGEFDKSGTRAIGTWKAMFEGVMCSEGTWEARPGESEAVSGEPQDEQSEQSP